MFGERAILHYDLPTYKRSPPEGKSPPDLLEKLQPAVTTLSVPANCREHKQQLTK